MDIDIDPRAHLITIAVFLPAQEAYDFVKEYSLTDAGIAEPEVFTLATDADHIETVHLVYLNEPWQIHRPGAGSPSAGTGSEWYVAGEAVAIKKMGIPMLWNIVVK